MTFSAYSIGIRLRLLDGVTAPLVAMSRSFASLHRDTERVERSLSLIDMRVKAIKTNALLGAVGVGGGLAAFALLGAPLKQAREFETSMARFKTLNLGAAINKDAEAFSRGAQVFGASGKVINDTLRETYGMLGDMGKAKSIVPLIAQLNAANAGLFGGKVDAIQGGAATSLKRFIDMRGLTNTPEQMKQGLDLAQRLVTGSGGELKFADLATFAKRAGASFRGMSEDALFMTVTAMQEMGGASAGTANMSIFQNLASGRTPAKTMAALKAAGLVTLGPSVDQGTIDGKPWKSTAIMSLKDRELFLENIPLWVMKNIIPKMDQLFKKDDISGRTDFINSIVSNRTASNLLVGFATQPEQTIRDAKIARNAKGAEGTIQEFAATTDGKMGNLTARWHDLLREVGTVLLPTFNKGLTVLTAALGSMATFARENPTITKVLVGSIAALAAASVAGGAFFLFKAAVAGVGLALGPVLAATGPSLITLAAGIAGVGLAIDGLFKLKGLPDAMKQLWDAKTREGVVQSSDTRKRIAGGELGQTRSINGRSWSGSISPYVASGRGGGPETVNATINMDGRKVGGAVIELMGREMNRPQTSAATFDGRRNLAAP